MCVKRINEQKKKKKKKKILESSDSRDAEIMSIHKTNIAWCTQAIYICSGLPVATSLP